MSVSPAEGIWWGTLVCSLCLCIMSSPCLGTTRFEFWLVVSWELAQEGLVGNTTALAATVDLRAVTGACCCPSYDSFQIPLNPG